MTDDAARNAADLARALATIIQAQTDMALQREADKVAFEELNTTVQILDARVEMLNARLEELHPSE